MSTETQARPLATAAPIGALQLSAKDLEQAFLLPQGPTSIGAGPKCDLRLDAPGLKPLHCVIVLQTDGVTVRRWSPGTKLNGSTFTEAPLAVGDCLSIGPVDLHVSEAEIDASERELPEWSVGELGDELSRDTEDPQESVPQMERSVLGPAAEDQESKDTSVSEPSRLLDTTFDDESVSADVSSEDSAEGLAATEDSLVPHDASTVHVLDAPLEESPTSDASEVKCRAEESGTSDLWEDFSIADSDVESASPKTDQVMARDAAAPPIPPHLLKPWEDAHRPGVSDESCDLSSCEDEVALIGDAWTEGNNLPASLLFASPVGEESENPHEGESTEPESEEGLSDEGTSAAGIDAPHEGERTDANPVVDEDDPEGFEFYTDVNWQSVDAGAAKEVGHAQSEAGSGIPTPHPINLAAILRGQEQLAAVRARAKQLVHTLRAERGAGAASREELSVFKNRCEELAACVDDLKTSLAERDEQYAGLEAEKLALDGELAELREAVSSQSTVNQELRDQLAEQAEKIASLSTAIENWESERTALNRELTSAREQLELQATPTPTAQESGNDGLLEATSGSKVDHAPGEERDEDHVDQPVESLTDPGLPSATNKSVSTADVWSLPLAETELSRSSSELDETLDPPNDTPLQDTTRDWTTALLAPSSGATDATAAADDQEPFVSGKTTPLWATNKPKVEAGAAPESHRSERATPAEASDELAVPTTDTDATRGAEIVPASQGSHEASPATQWGQDASKPEPASRIEPAIDPAGLWDIERSAQQESIDDAPSTDQAADAVWGIRLAEDAAAATREAAPTPTAAEHAPTASESTHTEPPVWGNQAEIQDERSTAPPVSAADPSWDGSSRVEATDEPVATVNEEPAPAFEMPHESSGEASDAGPTGASPIPDWLLDDSDDDEDGAAPESAASDEDPAPAFEAPKSFLDQYAHLLPAEDEPAQDEPVPGVPAAAVAPPATEPEAESTSADPDEEDIDAYMSRLMERMRGGGEAAANASSAVSPPQLDDETPSVPAPEPETPASPVKPMLSLDEIKRSVQPEQSTDMASLRRLANDSARQAIGVAASKHSREQSIANLVIATIAMASGGYLIASAPAIFSAQLVGGAFALLLAGVWVFRSVAHLLQSVRTGDHDGALQQRLNAEKLPINK